MPPTFDFDGAVEIIAHRGYSARAPENTLAAMELAIEVGADALEFDLHVASDGVPHLFHDRTLGRTSDGRGRFASKSSDHIASLDAGSWFDARFEAEPIPTLARTLGQVGGRVGRLYPEIKGYRSIDDVDTIVELVEASGALDRTVFISMEWEALVRIREHSAEIGIGYIVDHKRRVEPGFAQAVTDPRAMLDFDARLLLAEPETAARAVDASIELATWTVNRVEDAARLFEMGVRRFTTNEVTDLLDWKASL